MSAASAGVHFPTENSVTINFLRQDLGMPPPSQLLSKKQGKEFSVYHLMPANLFGHVH